MDDKYKGMTVNERLYVSGLLEKFEKAVLDNNCKKVVKILKKVEITDEQLINQIVKELGLLEQT